MNKDLKVYAFGNELMMLYGRVNLSQSEFATLVGISSVALRRWESGQSCPKAESLKRVIEILIHQGAFKKGAEQTEALHLWELAMQRGLKVPFDEVWFVGVVPSADPMPPKSVGVVLCADPVRGSDPLLCAGTSPTSPNGLTLAPAKARGRRKGRLAMLIALVMLLIIASTGTFFFSARDHATDQSYPGYLFGHGTLVFFDPLSQKRGSQWDTSSNDSEGISCQFIAGAYHVSTLQSDYRYFVDAGERIRERRKIEGMKNSHEQEKRDNSSPRACFRSTLSHLTTSLRSGTSAKLQEVAHAAGWKSAEQPGQWVRVIRTFRDGSKQTWWATSSASWRLWAREDRTSRNCHHRSREAA